MIKGIMDAYAASLNREWSYDRSQTVGASEIGLCMRKTFYAKNEGDPQFGVERDPDYVDSWGGKVRGSLMENHFWAPAMKAKLGDKLLFAGEDQQSLVSGFLSATPDGLIIGLERDALAHLGVPDIGSDCVAAESKTIDPRSNLDEAKPQNIFQTHVQLGMIREQTEYRPNFAIISYTDASFWDIVTEFVIPFDPAIYQAAKDRARQIMTATSVRDMEPEGFLAGGNECKHCPFTRACGMIRRSPPEENAPLDPQFAAEISDMTKEIAALETQVDSDEVRLRTLQQALRDRLREKGIRKIPGVVSWSGVKGRKTYDNKKIQAAAVSAGIDIEQFVNVGEPTDRLTITGAKKSGSEA